MAIKVSAINNMTAAKDSSILAFASDFLNGEGVVDLAGLDMQVTEQTPNAMGITVNKGYCYVKNDGWVQGSNQPKFYRVEIDASTNKALTPNASANDWIVAICIKVDVGTSTPGADGELAGTIEAVYGTPAASPSAPAIPNHHYPIAYVQYNSGHAVITNARITDLRSQASVDIVKVAGGLDGWIPAGEVWTYSSADSPSYVFTVPGDKTQKYYPGQRVKFDQDQAMTAYWNLDANSNSQVGSHNGTDTAISYTSGKFSNAATFNGTTSKIVLADHANLKPTGDFTIALWFKTNVTGTQKMLFQSFSANTNFAGINLYISTGNKLSLSVCKNTGTTLYTDWTSFNGNTTVTDNTWHQVVITFRNKYVQIYLDGNIEAEGYSVAPAYAATNYVRIGCGNNTGSDAAFMSGQIDDVYIINGYAVGQDYIKQKYQAQTAQGAVALTINKKGIITLVGNYNGTNTPITIYTGKDYALANATISNPYWSTQKAPKGFPTTPSKWTEFVLLDVTVDDTSISYGNWENALSISVPVGSWSLEYTADFEIRSGASGQNYAQLTLSDANNTAGGVEWQTVLNIMAAANSTPLLSVASKTYIKNFINLIAKKSFYLNYMGFGAGGTVHLYLYAGNGGVTKLSAICALL